MHQVLELLRVHIYYFVGAHYLHGSHQVGGLVLGICHPLLHLVGGESYLVEVLDTLDLWVLRLGAEHVDVARHLVFRLHVSRFEVFVIRLMLCLGDGIAVRHHILAQGLEIDVRLRAVLIDATGSAVGQAILSFLLFQYLLQQHHLPIHEIVAAFGEAIRLGDAFQLSLACSRRALSDLASNFSCSAPSACGSLPCSANHAFTLSNFCASLSSGVGALGFGRTSANSGSSNISNSSFGQSLVQNIFF